MADEKYKNDLSFSTVITTLTRATLNLADYFNLIFTQLISNDARLKESVETVKTDVDKKFSEINLDNINGIAELKTRVDTAEAAAFMNVRYPVAVRDRDSTKSDYGLSNAQVVTVPSSTIKVITESEDVETNG